MTSVNVPTIGELYASNVVKMARRVITATEASAQAVYDLFDLNVDNIFVEEIRTRVTTAWTASVTITVGDSDDADGWMTAATLAATTAVADSSGLFKTSGTADSDNAYGIGGGRLYPNSSDGNRIQMTVGGATPAAGELEVVMKYMIMETDA